MLKRTVIRRFLTRLLADPETTLPPEGHKGLTIAGDEVYDTLLSPPQFNDSGCPNLGDGYDLPAIAVFTENERRFDIEAEERKGCFTTALTAIIELYVCGKHGFEIEELLDSLEAQVSYKIFRAKGKPWSAITSYQSYAVRADGGRRVAMRRLEIEFKYSQTITSPADYLPGNMCISLKIPDKSE